MAKKQYRPKKGYEGLALTFPTAEKTVDISEWPYETASYEEQRFLDAHSQVTDQPEPKGAAASATDKKDDKKGEAK